MIIDEVLTKIRKRNLIVVRTVRRNLKEINLMIHRQMIPPQILVILRMIVTMMTQILRWIQFRPQSILMILKKLRDRNVRLNDVGK